MCSPGLHFTWLEAALMEEAGEKTVPPGLVEGTEGTTRAPQAVPIGSYQNTEEWVLLLSQMVRRKESVPSPRGISQCVTFGSLVPRASLLYSDVPWCLCSEGLEGWGKRKIGENGKKSRG